MKTSNKRGFSLFEILIVVLILTILTAIAIPFYQRSVLRSHAAEVNNLLSMVRTRQVKRFAETHQYANTFADNDLAKIAIGSDFYEENNGLTKRVNNDYILRLRTNAARDAGCVTGSYSPGGEDRFTFAISYTTPGLGCTDAPDSTYSVCDSFGTAVVGEVDTVCNMQQPEEPQNPGDGPIVNPCEPKECPVGHEFVDCKCVPCKEKPKPGYEFSKEGCEWKPCEKSCDEGYHFSKQCECEPDSESCGPCPGNQVLIDNESCKCACPEDTPVWDEKEEKCVICKEPTKWNPKTEKCACPKNTPVLIEESSTGDVKCVTCEESKPNSVWNSKKEICECSCSGGRILEGDDPAGEKCDCVCPKQTPVWDSENEQCTTCSGDKPIYNASANKCLSCYELYGEATPVWDERQQQCVSCYSKFPGKVVCSSGPSSLWRQEQQNIQMQQLQDYQSLSTLNSYAMKTGALLAQNRTEMPCGGNKLDKGTTTFINGKPKCQVQNQQAACKYNCISLGYYNIEGLTDSCGATLTNGGIDYCTCNLTSKTEGIWSCPDKCEILSEGYYETSTSLVSGCSMAPTLTCSPNLNWTSQGSCQDTWHNAKSYEPAKPVWIANASYDAGGYCASCGQVIVHNCSTDSSCGGITHDTFSGKVWDGSACVQLSNNYYLDSQSCVSLEILPIVKCYSNDGSCEPSCYWNRTQDGPKNCNIGGENYTVQGKGKATANIRNVLSSSEANIIQVYRQSYNKDYYALKKLNIMPSLKGSVITE